MAPPKEDYIGYKLTWWFLLPSTFEFVVLLFRNRISLCSSWLRTLLKGVMVHPFSSSTWETKAGQSLSSRSACSTQFQDSQSYVERTFGVGGGWSQLTARPAPCLPNAGLKGLLLCFILQCHQHCNYQPLIQGFQWGVLSDFQSRLFCPSVQPGSVGAAISTSPGHHR